MVEAASRFMRAASRHPLRQMRGDPARAEHYLNRRKSTTYWAESDLITAKAILNGSNDQLSFSIQVLKDILAEQKAISDNSRAILHLNIARMTARLGDIDATREHVDRARTIDSEIVVIRLAKDPFLAGLL
jgi:hypothetical protein